MAAAPHKLATFADLAALPDEVRAEIIHGAISEKAAPSAEHADSQAALAGFLRPRFHRGSGSPSGWWILTEIDVEYGAHELFRHDIAGWRRERVPQRPTGRPLRERPDWVAEILSPSNERRDLVDKFRVLQGAGVPYYWVLHPIEKVLVVHRLESPGYVVALTAGAGETVRAEPFAEVDLRVDVLFGDADDDGA